MRDKKEEERVLPIRQNRWHPKVNSCFPLFARSNNRKCNVLNNDWPLIFTEYLRFFYQEGCHFSWRHLPFHPHIKKNLIFLIPILLHKPATWPETLPTPKFTNINRSISFNDELILNDDTFVQISSVHSISPDFFANIDNSIIHVRRSNRNVHKLGWLVNFVTNYSTWSAILLLMTNLITPFYCPL